jgi:hypothetical protein
VGIYWDANFTFHGFLLSGGQYTPIDDSLAGSGAFQGTIPFSINASGKIVGVYIDSAGINHGFLLSGGQFSTIDDLLGVGAQGGTQPSQINDLGQIVGGYFDAAGLPHGYIQMGNQFTTVDDPAGNSPGQGTFANGINDLGQIVGDYIDSTGLEHGFLAIPADDAPAGASGAVAMANGSSPTSKSAWVDIGNSLVGSTVSVTADSNSLRSNVTHTLSHAGRVNGAPAAELGAFTFDFVVAFAFES